MRDAPAELRARQCDAVTLRRLNAIAAIVLISPYGQTGPKADLPATDLTLLYASGIARPADGTGRRCVGGTDTPGWRASAFIGGLAAACAGMFAAQVTGAVIDVSIEEALATMAMTELAGAALHGRSRSRKRITDGNGATVCILPARDGYTAISPREDRQWAAWLAAMGSPAWGTDPRFARKPDRVANWDALHALMSEWSRKHDKQWIADTAQKARVPSFPLRELAEQLEVAATSTPRFLSCDGDRGAHGAGTGSTVRIVGGAHGKHWRRAAWAVAVVGRARARFQLGDRGTDDDTLSRRDGRRRHQGGGAWTRRSRARVDLHTVLGQAKQGIVLDLKQPEAVEVARSLAERCDVLVENFATGVMDRLGLGVDALRSATPA